MPVEIEANEMPTFVRTGTVTKYADIFTYLTGWMQAQSKVKKDEDRKAVIFTGLTPEQAELPEDEQPETDGITKDNWGAIASGIRRVAKDQKYKVQILFKEDEMRLYVKFGGDYVALTPEQIKQRAQKRRTNKINALTEKYQAEGMTESNAKKRATEEVGALKVV